MLAISVEYQLVPGEVMRLFEKVTTGFVPLYTRVAQSELRNSAAKYHAMTYLTANPPEGNRENIAMTMLNDLRDALAPFHATVLRVFLTDVTLPKSFEDSFVKVEQLKLEQKQVEADLALQLQQAQMANETKVIQMVSSNEQQVVSAKIQVSKAAQSRSAQLVKANQDGRRAMIEAKAARERALIQAEGEVEATLSSRAGVLTTEQIAGDAAYRQAESKRMSTLAEARSEVAAAEIAREGAVQEAENEYLKAQLQAQTARTTTLSEAEVKKGQAEAEREAVLAKKRTELLRTEVENARLLLEAQAAADRKAVAANATSQAAIVLAQAEVEGMRQTKSAQLASYFGLRDAGMNNTEMLRYLYAQTLRSAGDSAGSKVFVDYTKMPMLMEGMGAGGGGSGAANVQQAAANSVADKMLKSVLPELLPIASNADGN